MRSGVFAGAILIVWSSFGAPPESRAPPGFGLRMPKLFDAAFSHGGALKIPKEPVRELEFSLAGTAAQRIQDGAVSVHINGASFDAEIAHALGRLAVAVKANDEPDLLSKTGLTRIEVKVRGFPMYDRTWIVDRHSLPFAVETSGDDDGVPVEIQLTAPSLPLVIRKGEAKQILFRGSVNRLKPSVEIHGAAATLGAEADGSTAFTQTISLRPDEREIVVEARGSKLDLCRLVIPVHRL